MGVTELPRRTSRESQVLCFEGDFDVANLDLVERAVAELVAHSGAPSVILDLSNVTFMSVGMIAVLERVERRLASSGRALTLRSPSKKARSVLDRFEVAYDPPIGFGLDLDGTDSGMHSSASS
jgi:anti-anti-sigma factor